MSQARNAGESSRNAAEASSRVPAHNWDTTEVAHPIFEHRDRATESSRRLSKPSKRRNEASEGGLRRPKPDLERPFAFLKVSPVFLEISGLFLKRCPCPKNPLGAALKRSRPTSEHPPPTARDPGNLLGSQACSVGLAEVPRGVPTRVVSAPSEPSSAPPRPYGPSDAFCGSFL